MTKYYQLRRDGDVFTAYCDTYGTPVFRVTGAQAARAATRLLGIATPIQDYFFDNPHGSRVYNVCDDPNDPYLGAK